MEQISSYLVYHIVSLCKMGGKAEPFSWRSVEDELAIKYLGAVHMRWAGPATWAGSARWGVFHPAFIWNFLSHCRKLVRHCKKIVLIKWLLSGKFYIFNIDSRKLQQFHFTVYSMINMITAFSIFCNFMGFYLY